MPVVTALEIQKRNKERVNVYLDNEYAFSLEIMAAAQLRKGQELDDNEIADLRDQDDVTRAVDRAVRFLSYRPRSITEVRRNLAEKKVDDAVIDAAIERLKNLGYLDDRSFAAYWVENRDQFKPLSERALRYELRQKGIADSIIKGVLDDLDEAGAAYRAAQSQVRRHRHKTHDEFRAKISAFLQRRGFGYDVIREAVDQLIIEIENEEPDYFDVASEE
jgi:regulatory protein